MTQLSSKSIQVILQKALGKDGDSLKELLRRTFQSRNLPFIPSCLKTTKEVRMPFSYPSVR